MVKAIIRHEKVFCQEITNTGKLPDYILLCRKFHASFVFVLIKSELKWIQR
jgi:hypothetical protein